MAAFKPATYVIELYSPGAVDPDRVKVTFTKRDGSTAIVGTGEASFATAAHSCTCVDFTLGDKVCNHMRARERAFRKFARDYRLPQQESVRPLWAEDVRD